MIIAVVVLAFAVSYAIQRKLTSMFDYHCRRCDATFALTPAAAAVAPHSMGKKFGRCPNCGAWSWLEPVPKEH
ncbi:hypothetical protein LK10_16070 [Sinomonas humi]|uniref:Uncharacterized protein n=1 Tax=Sinomonas humi TaxID=1338436 RepID=A0A0B2AHU8_9MICC|nr:hypothetical protein LK10_16070 [Sinomonas humi]